MIANLKRYAMRDINLKPMAQQTAVALLREALDAEMKMGTKMVVNWDMYLQMEKEQIVEAFYEGMKTNPFDPNRGRGTMYYNETYKKQ